MHVEPDKHSQSQDSGIRIGEHFELSDKANRNEHYYKGRKHQNKSESGSKIEMNQSEELNEIMEGERMKDEINQDSTLKMDSNGGNMTTDLETNNERPSVVSTKKTSLPQLTATDQKKTPKSNEK